MGESQVQIAYLTEVYRQMNNLLKITSEGSELLKHGLEKGLSNEEIIRDMFRLVLPQKYGVAKGKIINSKGKMSNQIDVIVYDNINCPCLFIDENENQVIPIEGVYFFADIKTTLSKSKLNEAFINIKSVKDINENIVNVSLNEKIDIIPPIIAVIAFKDKRKLETVYNNYIEYSEEYKISYNSHSYSKKSPAYENNISKYYMISDIVIINKGIVHHMYDGFPVKVECKKDAIGIFLVSLVTHLQEMKISIPNYMNYFGRTGLLYHSETRYDGKFIEINDARAKWQIKKLEETIDWLTKIKKFERKEI